MITVVSFNKLYHINIQLSDFNHQKVPQDIVTQFEFEMNECCARNDLC